MRRLDELRQATRVRVSRPHVGAVIGRIEHIFTLAELYGALGTTDDDVNILRELSVSRVARISYRIDDEDVIFSAFECADGWRDTNNRALMLEIVGQHEWPQPKQQYVN